MEMENLGKLSSRVLSITCPCGIVFETYDPKKMYHANSCRAICVRKRYGALIAQRRKHKQKKFEEKNKE
jgi:hypothetical protein